MSTVGHSASTTLGGRRTDIIIFEGDVPKWGIEVKSGGARYGGTQLAKDLFIETQGAEGKDLGKVDYPTRVLRCP